jgi:hypothetical protein
MLHLMEGLHIIPLGNSADFNAGFTAESINTKNIHSILYLLSYGAVGGAGAAALTVKSGVSDGVQTTAETFYSRYSSAAQAAASGDLWSAWTSQTTLSVATATITTRAQQVFIDCSTLTNGQPWLTLALGAEADSGIIHGFAVCWPRYPGNVIATAI